MRQISEAEFSEKIHAALSGIKAGSVTGPGRSGAIAAVYASHILRIPFFPYKCPAPVDLGPVLVIDTATESGATLRKAARLYSAANPVVVSVFREPPRVYFWYEAGKPQHYEKETKKMQSENLKINTTAESHEHLQDAWAARCRTDAPTLLAYVADGGVMMIAHKLTAPDAALMVMGLLNYFPDAAAELANLLAIMSEAAE